MNPKYEILENGSIRAPFETEAEVAAYRLEHQDAIAAYNASQVPAEQPVSRNTPTKLGAMLLDIKEQPETEGLNDMARMIFDTKAMKIADAIKIIRQAQPATA